MRLRKTNRAYWQSVEACHTASIKHLRSEGLDDDALINLNLDAAEQDIENELGFPIVDCVLTGFQCDFSAIRLPAHPTYRFGTLKVEYFDTDEVFTLLDATKYRVLNDGVWVRIVFKTDLPVLFDCEDAVWVTLSAGFEGAYAVESLYKQVILTRAASRYADREEIAEKYKKASDAMVDKIRNRNA